MGNGNGVIYRRGKTWTIGFTVNMRRVREAIGPSKRLAEMVLKKRISDALQGMYFPQKRNLGRMPFREFAEMYLERVLPFNGVDSHRADSGAAVDQAFWKSIIRSGHKS